MRHTFKCRVIKSTIQGIGDGESENGRESNLRGGAGTTWHHLVKRRKISHLLWTSTGIGECLRSRRPQPRPLLLLPEEDGDVPRDYGPWRLQPLLPRGVVVAVGRSGPPLLLPSWLPGCKLWQMVKRTELRSQTSDWHTRSSLDQLDFRFQHDSIDFTQINYVSLKSVFCFMSERRSNYV